MLVQMSNIRQRRSGETAVGCKNLEVGKPDALSVRAVFHREVDYFLTEDKDFIGGDRIPLLSPCLLFHDVVKYKIAF